MKRKKKENKTLKDENEKITHMADGMEAAHEKKMQVKTLKLKSYKQ